MPDACDLVCLQNGWLKTKLVHGYEHSQLIKNGVTVQSMY